jgi:hypothetical protein
MIFLLVVVAGLFLIIRHKRSTRNRPTQSRGVEPHAQEKLIVADLGEARFSQTAHAYHVTTDPQAYAKTFVPPEK